MKKYHLIIIFLIAIFIFLSAGITYSLFNAKAYGSLNEKIAKFVFEANKLDGFELPIKEIVPGISKEFNFQVTNEVSQKRSDVSIGYQITIKTFHFMPLEIGLYDEKDELIMTCDESFTRNDLNELVCNTAILTMPYDVSSVRNYKLKVSFPEEYNSEDYVGLVDFIALQINSHQMTQK